MRSSAFVRSNLPEKILFSVLTPGIIVLHRLVTSSCVMHESAFRATPGWAEPPLSSDTDRLELASDATEPSVRLTLLQTPATSEVPRPLTPLTNWL
jgi:hypothetical protein